VAKEFRFPTLILAVATAGLSQGLTLPLLSILIEQQGISATMNGWSAASLYMGMLIASFMMEKPIRRFGYKPIILFGMFAVLCSSLMIPAWNNLIWWIILRFFIGVGDSSLHCATQLWITDDSTQENRGQRISIYGFSYGAGFSVGPLGVNLLEYGLWVPFLIVGAFYLFAIVLVYLLNNAHPEHLEKDRNSSYTKTFALGWFALMPALLYGFLESTLNGSVPIYILRSGIPEGWVSIVLFTFSAGALLTQLPLGMLSDRLGRKRVLMFSGCVGAIGFLLAPLFGSHPLLMSIWMGCIGAMVGSLFSLGLAYLADILPKHLMPTGNVLASVLFSIGSMTGPGITGMGMQYVHPASAFYFLGMVFGTFFFAGFVFKHSIQLKQDLFLGKDEIA
jgi:MFS family permease